MRTVTDLKKQEPNPWLISVLKTGRDPIQWATLVGSFTAAGDRGDHLVCSFTADVDQSNDRRVTFVVGVQGTINGKSVSGVIYPSAIASIHDRLFAFDFYRDAYFTSGVTAKARTKIYAMVRGAFFHAFTAKLTEFNLTWQKFVVALGAMHDFKTAQDTRNRLRDEMTKATYAMFEADKRYTANVHVGTILGMAQTL